MQQPQETWVWSLGQEDSLEEGMAAHSSVLVWRIPWTEEPRLQSIGSQRVRHDWVTWSMCTRVSEGRKFGALSNGTGVLTRRRRDIRNSLSAPVYRRVVWRHGEKVAIYPPGTGGYSKTNLTAPWSWTFSLQNHEKINFGCLNQLVCGISLCKP